MTELTERIRRKELHRGAWLSLGHPIVVELAARYKIDWMLVDMEHGYTTEENLLHCLIAARNTGVAVVVRLGKFDPALTGRVLDWGAAGIMLPHVDRAEDAARCVKAMNYPPEGTRGFSASARCFDYGFSTVQHPHTVKPLFFAQIESEEAVDNAREIAAVEGVDVLFIGPSDLKLDYRSKGQGNDAFEQAVEQILRSARHFDKQVGIVTKSGEEFEHYASKGMTCISYGSDLQFLKDGFTRLEGLNI